MPEFPKSQQAGEVERKVFEGDVLPPVQETEGMEVPVTVTMTGETETPISERYSLVEQSYRISLRKSEDQGDGNLPATLEEGLTRTGVLKYIGETSRAAGEERNIPRTRFRISFAPDTPKPQVIDGEVEE